MNWVSIGQRGWFLMVLGQLRAIMPLSMCLKKGSGPNRSFLAANSTKNYFLIANILSFFDIRDKSAVLNILRKK